MSINWNDLLTEDDKLKLAILEKLESAKEKLKAAGEAYNTL